MALALPSPAGNPRAGGPLPVALDALMADPETLGLTYDEVDPEQVPAQPQDADPQEKGFDLSLLVSWFEDAEEMTDQARRLSERDRDYYDNKQLTPEELRILELRGQPAVIINRIQTKVNYLKGFEASQRSDPRAYPRTPQDEEASEAATDALRYVGDKANINLAFSDTWENMLIEGFGGLEVIPRPTPEGDAEFDIKVWPWDRLFYDPYSRNHEFEDARYLGTVIWMDFAEALEKWPNATSAINKTLEGEEGNTYDDRPSWRKWAANGRRRRVRICQMYYKKNEVWHWCIFTSGGKIAEGVVPYKDEDGKSLCPLILQSAFVDRENNRYGFVRALISPQDEINKRRSKMLHEASVRQFVYETGAVNDVDRVKAELARPDGGVEVNPGQWRFELLDRSKEIAAHTALQQEAKMEIDLMGPNSAMQGKGERDASGRAILANQQGGQIEVASLMDRHKRLKDRTYRLLWSLIRMYWTAEKWIRVTDEEKNSKFVGLNSPVMLAEKLLEMAEQKGLDPEVAKQAMKAAIARDPSLAMELEQVVETKRIPAEMTMDIVLEEVPDTANIQQEQFEILTQLGSTGQVQLPPKVWIAASALRNKRELMEMLDQQNEQDPAIAEANRIALEKAQAEVDKLLSEIEKNRATAIKAKVEADMLDAQVGQIINPQVVDIGAGMAQLPDGQIMQQDGQGGLKPVAPALDPNAEADRAFQAEQAERGRMVDMQKSREGLAAKAQGQQADIAARGQQQQLQLTAREREQATAQQHQSREAEAARHAEAVRAAEERAAMNQRQSLDQLYNR
jgi:hypothetical protein